MKTCFKCGETKPLTEFYQHLEMADGYLGKCKDCAKADVKTNYRTRREQYVQYEKSRWPKKKDGDRRRKQGAAYKEYKRRWRSENRPKWQAHNAVAKALQNGTLIKQVCEQCGGIESKAHHPDYSKPLDVVWLCDDCHRREHSRLRGIAA
jgi:hypothetical protein